MHTLQFINPFVLEKIYSTRLVDQVVKHQDFHASYLFKIQGSVFPFYLCRLIICAVFEFILISFYKKTYVLQFLGPYLAFHTGAPNS